MVGYGVERRGEDRHGVERQAGPGLQAWAVWQGMSVKGSAGQAWTGTARSGGHGRRGMEWSGEVRTGKAWQAWRGEEGKGQAWRGEAGKARRG